MMVSLPYLSHTAVVWSYLAYQDPSDGPEREAVCRKIDHHTHDSDIPKLEAQERLCNTVYSVTSVNDTYSWNVTTVSASHVFFALYFLCMILHNRTCTLCDSFYPSHTPLYISSTSSRSGHTIKAHQKRDTHHQQANNHRRTAAQ